MKRQIVEWIVLASWLGVLLAGFGALMFYSKAPGHPGTISSSWPERSAISQPDGRACLLMFIHPKCPCTRASVRQLERALAASPRNIDVWMVVFDPSGRGENWAKTGLVDLAEKLPGAQIFMDRDGKEIRRFGVRTSGDVLVFDREGRLAFSGGVTPSRGHEGPCDGCDAVRRLARGELPLTRQTPSYGCTILGPASYCTGREASCPPP